MELGNMFLGNSRGEVPVPRDKRGEILAELFEAIWGKDYDYHGEEFENEVFLIFPYWWGDCTCGFDDHKFEEDHTENCYQSELRRAIGEYEIKSGYGVVHAAAFGSDESPLPGMKMNEQEVEPGMFLMEFEPRSDAAMERWRQAHAEREKFLDSLYRVLCKKHGLKLLGCAAHCTCDYDERYMLWLKRVEYPEGHKEDCALVKPNFCYKPTDYRLKWYKYPLRDSYANRHSTIAEWRKMVNDCMKSLSRADERVSG